MKEQAREQVFQLLSNIEENKKVIPTIKYIGDMLQKKLENNEGGNKKNANRRRERK